MRESFKKAKQEVLGTHFEAKNELYCCTTTQCALVSVIDEKRIEEAKYNQQAWNGK